MQAKPVLVLSQVHSTVLYMRYLQSRVWGQLLDKPLEAAQIGVILHCRKFFCPEKKPYSLVLLSQFLKFQSGKSCDCCAEYDPAACPHEQAG